MLSSNVSSEALLRPLESFSERRRSTGGVAAEGVANQLGRPDIEPLEVLVREAVQNSWDARRTDSPSVRVEIRRTTLRGEALRHLRHAVLPGDPGGIGLAQTLDAGVDLLTFSDFGTTGLDGPTRADLAMDPAEANFVDMVYNVGQPPDKNLGGGSFGYGKASFFLTSSVRTVLIDTLCRTGRDRLERRFIGMALGPSHVAPDGAPRTGRHWWGRVSAGLHVEPAIGGEADALAAAIGLPERSGEGCLGTTIAVVAPRFATDSGEEMTEPLEFIASCLLWNFWPKLVPEADDAPASMGFRVYDNGHQVHVPDPRRHLTLQHFVECLNLVRDDSPPGDRSGGLLRTAHIASRRPAKDLGRLALTKVMTAPAGAAPPPSADQSAPVPSGEAATRDGLRHIALMRVPELIVRYLPCAQPPPGQNGYAGVFKCLPAVDEIFRSAEPPTHDDWVARAVPPPGRTMVNVGIRSIQNEARSFVSFDGDGRGATSADDVPLGQLSDRLASLIPSVAGPGGRAAPASRDPRTRAAALIPRRVDDVGPAGQAGPVGSAPSERPAEGGPIGARGDRRVT